MSDEQNTTETPADTNPAPDVATETVESLKAEVEKWRSLSRKNEDRAKENAEAAKAWAAYQESSRTDEEKRAEELETLRARAAELESALNAKDREVLVERVAASKGVPARYLNGSTEEELVASADQFLEDAKTLAAPVKPVGYVASQATGEPSPAVSSVEDARARAAAKYGAGQ